MASRELDVVLDHLRNLSRSSVPPPGQSALRAMRRMTEQYSTVDPACGRLRTVVTPVDVDGVPGEFHSGPQCDPGRRLLYIHGGGWMGGSLSSHRSLVSNIAATAQVTALAIDYRLAPHHRFPAALDDCVTAFDWLMANGPDGPRAARSTFIAGDSAGGNIALATLIRLRDRAVRRPTGAIVLSPVTTFANDGESRQARAHVDPIIAGDSIEPTGRAYAPEPQDLSNPLLSPINGDLRGLPPLLIQVGGAEVLLSDSTEFATAARAAGVDVTLEVWDDMPHVFACFAPFLPEAVDAIDHIATFLRRIG